MEKLFLGIDIGSSSIKFIVQNELLETYFENQVDYEYQVFNDNWVEIDPNIWMDIIINEMKLISKFDWSQHIVALSIVGQMHTTVFVDSNGNSIRPAIMWNDKRTIKEVESIFQKVKSISNLKTNSKLISTGSPLVNLLWLKTNEAHNYERLHKFLIAKDYICYKMTGNFFTDYCDASTSGLYDFDSENWSNEISQIFDIPIEIYPEINCSGNLAGVLSDVMREITNLSQEIKVFVGTGDNASTFFASDSNKSNDLLISLGSSGVLLSNNQDNRFSEKGKNISFKLLSSINNSITQGSITTGGKALSWWIEDVLETKDYQSELSSVDEKTILNNEIFFLPYMNGEKYVFNNQHFKGLFLGLTPNTSREDMTLAVMEGIAFSLKNLSDNLMKSQFNQIKVLGGGSKNVLLLQIIASVFQKSVINVSTNADAVRGAVKIAVKGYYNEEIEFLNLNNNLVISPIEELSMVYEEKFKKFLRLSEYMNNYFQIGNQRLLYK